MLVDDTRDLGERYRHAVAGGQREIRQLGRRQPLALDGACHDLHLFGAIADHRHRHAGNQRLQALRDRGGVEPEGARAVLINDQADRRHHLVPVEMRIDGLLVLAHYLADAIGDLADLGGVGAHGAELHGKPDRRAEVEAVHPHAGSSQCALGDGTFDLGFQAFASLDIPREDDNLRKGLVGQHEVEAEPEARRPLPDVGGGVDEILVAGEQLLGLARNLCRRGDRGTLRQTHFKEKFRSLGEREELLRDASKANDRAGENGGCDQKHDHVMPDAEGNEAPEPRINRPVVERGMAMFGPGRMRLYLQDLDTKVGREHHSHHPGGDEREADHDENRAGVFTDGRIREADRQEARRRHQRAREHREGRGLPGVGGSLHPVPAFLHLHDHHLDGDDRVIDKQAERDDERAERDPVQVDVDQVHDREDDRQHQRHGKRHDDAGAPSEREERHRKHDRQRLDEGLDEFLDGIADDLRLVGDALNADAHRQFRLEICHRLVDILAEGEDVAALEHDNADADGRFTVLVDQEIAGVLEPARDLRDVAKPERAAARLDRDRLDRVDAVERTGDAQRNALRAGLESAGGRDRILPGDSVENCAGGNAERRELGVAELDVDALFLRAVNVHLRDIRHPEQRALEIFRHAFQLGVIRAIAGDHGQDRIDVAEFIVDAGADDPRGQVGLEIAELLPELIEQLRHLFCGRVILEFHLHCREAGLRVGDDAVEIGEFLQLLLDAVRHLALHLHRGRAGPGDLNDADLDGEGGVFRATEPHVGKRAGKPDHDDQEQDEGLVANGPGRKVDPLHGSDPYPSFASPSARTFWPARRVWMPSVTTRSPSARPSPITACRVS